jgi:hypothetical protein
MGLPCRSATGPTWVGDGISQVARPTTGKVRPAVGVPSMDKLQPLSRQREWVRARVALWGVHFVSFNGSKAISHP